MQPRIVALLAVVIPLLGIHLAYLQSAFTQQVPWCLPYLAGCTSISRAARSGESIFLFRALLMPCSIILVCFWLYADHWLRLAGDSDSNCPALIRTLGITGALFLILYVDYLGTQGPTYSFMRRFGTIVFFSCSGLAQLLFTSRLYKINLFIEKHRLQRCRMAALTINLAVLALALANIVVALFAGERYAANNIIEWWISTLMLLYPLTTAYAWKRTAFKNWSSIIS